MTSSRCGLRTPSGPSSPPALGDHRRGAPAPIADARLPRGVAPRRLRRRLRVVLAGEARTPRRATTKRPNGTTGAATAGFARFRPAGDELDVPRHGRRLRRAGRRLSGRDQSVGGRDRDQPDVCSEVFNRFAPGAPRLGTARGRSDHAGPRRCTRRRWPRDAGSNTRWSSFLSLAGVATLERISGHDLEAAAAATEALEVYEARRAPAVSGNRVDTAADLRAGRRAVLRRARGDRSRRRRTGNRRQTLLEQAELLRAEAGVDVPWFQRDERRPGAGGDRRRLTRDFSTSAASGQRTPGWWGSSRRAAGPIQEDLVSAFSLTALGRKQRPATRFVVNRRLASWPPSRSSGCKGTPGGKFDNSEARPRRRVATRGRRAGRPLPRHEAAQAARIVLHTDAGRLDDAVHAPRHRSGPRAQLATGHAVAGVTDPFAAGGGCREFRREDGLPRRLLRGRQVDDPRSSTTPPQWRRRHASARCPGRAPPVRSRNSHRSRRAAS